MSNTPEDFARSLQSMIDECVLDVNKFLDVCAAKLCVERSRFVRRHGRTIWIGRRPLWPIGQDDRTITCHCGRFIPYEDSACSPKCLAKISSPEIEIIQGHLRGLEQIRRGEIVSGQEVGASIKRRLIKRARMNCVEFDELMDTYKISDAEVSLLLEHLESCHKCSDKYPPMTGDEFGLYIDEIL